MDATPQANSAPFLEPAWLILMSLAAGPMHGYAMMEEIRHLWAVQIGPGTLYGALARLEHHGLVEALPSEDRRRPYHLTPAGASALRTMVARLHHFTEMGFQRLAQA
jgi:DNA-binding PadR family transcriptional regulator